MTPSHLIRLHGSLFFTFSFLTLIAVMLSGGKYFDLLVFMIIHISKIRMLIILNCSLCGNTFF